MIVLDTNIGTSVAWYLKCIKIYLHHTRTCIRFGPLDKLDKACFVNARVCLFKEAAVLSGQ